jgi:hypothetical protein
MANASALVASNGGERDDATIVASGMGMLDGWRGG